MILVESENIKQIVVCGKHCSLLSPRCGRGQDQASQATAEYYEAYGEESV